MSQMTPREIVHELNRHIIGQDDAKRAVAIALRVVGTIFLAVCLLRALKGHFTQERHVGFEAAAWYWHFVDVVWLFLFAAVYIWGG